MSEQSDKVNEIIMNESINKVSKQADDFYDALVASKENNCLPENLFVGHFLPFFSGDKPISSNPQLMSEWIGVAGSPMDEVDIIDNTGERLFTVPSLFDTSILIVNERKAGNSIVDIYNEYDLKNNNIPVVAENYLRGALDNKIKDMLDSSKHKEDDRWKEIFKRYNIIVDTDNDNNKIEEDPGSELEY